MVPHKTSEKFFFYQTQFFVLCYIMYVHRISCQKRTKRLFVILSLCSFSDRVQKLVRCCSICTTIYSVAWLTGLEASSEAVNVSNGWLSVIYSNFMWRFPWIYIKFILWFNFTTLKHVTMVISPCLVWTCLMYSSNLFYFCFIVQSPALKW